ncbi:hypothetical protein V1290_005759 [Bradyrhizobium sp. AZCC 1578]
MRWRIRLSAFARKRISSGPRSGSGASVPFRLKLSAAFANDDSGAVSARAAYSPSIDHRLFLGTVDRHQS